MQQQSSILGLDIGSVRVGVARASWPDGIPTKLTVLANGPDLVDKLTELVRSENVSLLVAGLPRSLDGNETSQTRQTTQQVELLKQELKLPIYLQDEAVTSLKAEEELKASGKDYTKSDIDLLSALYILEDFINTHPGGAGLEF